MLKFTDSNGLMATNCSVEQSFSMMKRVENEYMANTSQDRLSAMALICSNTDKQRTLNVDDVM